MTVEGSSKKSKTTKYRSGTASYRAPEILAQIPRFTQKVDLWAVGCILYELVTGETLFDGDHEVMRYAASDNNLEMPIFPFSKPTNFFLLDLIRNLLSVNPSDRASTSELSDILLTLQLDPSLDEGTFDWVTGGDEELKHCRTLGSGGSGTVHEVSRRLWIYANLQGRQYVYMQGTALESELKLPAFRKEVDVLPRSKYERCRERIQSHRES